MYGKFLICVQLESGITISNSIMVSFMVWPLLIRYKIIQQDYFVMLNTILIKIEGVLKMIFLKHWMAAFNEGNDTRENFAVNLLLICNVVMKYNTRFVDWTSKKKCLSVPSVDRISNGLNLYFDTLKSLIWNFWRVRFSASPLLLSNIFFLTCFTIN